VRDRDHYVEAASALELPTDAVINGESVPAASGNRFASISPRDGSTVAAVAECDAADVDKAVIGARAAFDAGDWSRMAPRDRRVILRGSPS
jgi:gamma-glutamyl-gamma-aminobutyraldehyde dehydrogenase